jgi:hypothetical protein
MTRHLREDAYDPGPMSAEELWFSMDSFGAFLGSVTTIGVFTEFTLPGFPRKGGSDTSGLAMGPDGNIWYTIGAANQVVELFVPHET